MTKILIGLILISLELSITIQNTFIVGLLPDFAGYLLLVFGMREVSYGETDYYANNRKFTFWIGAFSFMVYVMNLIGISSTGSYEALLMQMLVVILEPISLYRLVKGIKAMERDFELPLNAKPLFVLWLLMTIFSVLTFALSMFPEIFSILNIALTVVSLIFIAVFYKTKRVYDDACVELTKEELEEMEA